ncbi:hypothetical protein [Stigmatella aurantiaca]|uniref:Lipoprotein n=1 Tax=Stigmatella aurantiaca (strain DW4/3-1) TaxID=378806 RepID=Q08YJ6_STIAD|nr:hypothetical protein [Stigmatella aurantiaca]ADO73763.1 uncharacterized protein STAUR_6003 [Stigmatella aurantiaca DW4/3-1]EAU65566.1 hypothetical protein STIAU_7639 [Stigmatella aurantiaca DW4/3-1]
MKHTLMMAAVSAVMAMGCGTDQMEGQESTALEPSTTVQGLVKEKTHCVVQALSVKHGEALPTGIAAPPASCFDTFAEAISHATKGAVKLNSHVTAQDLKEMNLGAAGIAAVEYDFPNLLGATLTLNASYTCAESDLYVASLPTVWDNRISSAISYDPSCKSFNHYTEPNFLGGYVNCGSACNLGPADNLTSSIYMRYF